MKFYVLHHEYYHISKSDSGYGNITETRLITLLSVAKVYHSSYLLYVLYSLSTIRTLI